MNVEKYKDFFENRDLVSIVDALAIRYGQTPVEILTGMTLFEFSFNVAVMVIGRIEENKNREKNNPDQPITVPLASFGIHRTVVMDKKKEVK